MPRRFQILEPALLMLILLLSIGARTLPAADFVVTELMAANSSTLKDEDGEFSDWIEVFNPNPTALSLLGWRLTDDSSLESSWIFPDLRVAPQSFIVVFASGKNRRDPSNPLHTNFKLDRDGEYLALLRPDGSSTDSVYTPSYPRQMADISYGPSTLTNTERLLTPEISARFLIPTDPLDDPPGMDWASPTFDDRAWSLTTLGIGYDRPPADGSEPIEPADSGTDITRPGDQTIATSSNSPSNEGVSNAIDDNPTTKYLNFDKLSAGLTVSPSAGPSVVTGLRLTSANDAPERDPTSFILSGSVDGRTFVEIVRRSIPPFTNRFTSVNVAFTNLSAYTHYRLLFPTVRSATTAVAMQIAEIELLGRIGPEEIHFADWIQSNVGDAMFGRSASLCLRMPFTLISSVARPHLALQMKYDDGFVAFLNGVEIARANAPAMPGYPSFALTNRARAQAVQTERFAIGHFSHLLHEGTNLLAVLALNDQPDSPDFLLHAQLDHSDVVIGSTGYFGTPTPGRTNGPTLPGFVADIFCDRPRGFYENPVDVALSCSTEAASIYYTLDGSSPSPTNGIPYSISLRINRTTVLRARAFRPYYHPSPVLTHSYIFLDDVVAQTRSNALAAGFPSLWGSQSGDYGLDPRVVGPNGADRYGGKYTRSLKSDLQTLPSMSIVMARDDMFGPQGIYSNPENRGDAWERAGSLELIYPDGSPGFQENAGFRIQGGAFRRFDLTFKKSFRVVFRETYGATRLRYPLFGAEATDAFDNFVLRANSNDAWPYFGASSLYIRDAFAMDTARAMGMIAPTGGFVHLYINGLYWGLYNPVERPDAAFSASYHGGDKSSWDAINQDSAPDGNYDAWNRMLSLLNQGMSRTEIYQKIQGNDPDGTRNPDFEDLLDVENMIDYVILNIYVGNTDWPGRNWWTGRNRENGEGFQFYPWDTETALGVTGLEIDVTGANSAVARPYAAARANAEFRMRFADHVYRHFFNGGALYVNPASPSWAPARPNDNLPAARLAALASLIDRAIVGESARWGDQRNSGPFTRDEHWQRERDQLLNNYFPRRSGIVLQQLRRAGLYPQIDPPVMNQRGGQVPAGFQLTLNATQGTIYYTTNGSDPRAPITVGTISSHTLATSNATKRILVPSLLNGGDKLGAAWQGGAEPFNDASWLAGAGAVGYDREPTYASLIGANLRSVMDTSNTSAFIRIPFQYEPTSTGPLNYMVLRMQYDDGFVAFLNGTRIASANAPSVLAWNASASASNNDSASVSFEEFKADAGLAALKPGSNILSIHGLNATLTSTDFLIGTELVVGMSQSAGGSAHATAYSGPIPLHDLTTIKARTLNGQEWSALQEAQFVVGEPLPIVSEIHYHPADPTAEELAAGFADADDFEFIELHNGGSTTCDLGGLRFVRGIDFNFQLALIRVLRPGQYTVLVRNRAAFEKRYGQGLPVAGEFGGQLSNSGEPIEIRNAQDKAIIQFAYATRMPWPREPDGLGPSLVLTDPEADPNQPASWRASETLGGIPGRPDIPVRLSLQTIATEHDHLLLRFESHPNSGYTILFRESLSAGAWETLRQVTQPDPRPSTEVRVELSTNAPTRFFRISIP